MVSLRVPGRIEYRDLAIRAVAAGCTLMREHSQALRAQPASGHGFDDQVISAFGEAFNNVVQHSYNGGAVGEVAIDLEFGDDWLALRVTDWGHSFDFGGVPAPDLHTLHESGAGVFIIRSFMDEVVYAPGAAPGQANVLSMKKRLPHG